MKELVGNLELRENLPFGAINEIAKTFGHTPAWIAKVIAGKKNGNLQIIECAYKIASLNQETKIKINTILKEYEAVTQL